MVGCLTNTDVGGYINIGRRKYYLLSNTFIDSCNLFLLFSVLKRCLVSFKELYSFNEMMTTFLFFPLDTIRISSLSHTLSNDDFKSFLNSVKFRTFILYIFKNEAPYLI